MPINSNKPRFEFSDAARLAYEWHDTISYTALAGYSAFETHNHGALDGVGIFGTVALALELFRAARWSATKNLRTAGVRLIPIDRWQNTIASLAGACIVLPAYLAPQAARLMAKYPTPRSKNVIEVLCVFSALGLVSIIIPAAGGFRRVYETYRDILWDYPRKKGGDGNGDDTQTEKLISRVKKQQAFPQATPFRSIVEARTSDLTSIYVPRGS